MLTYIHNMYILKNRYFYMHIQTYIHTYSDLSTHGIPHTYIRTYIHIEKPIYLLAAIPRSVHCLLHCPSAPQRSSRSFISRSSRGTAFTTSPQLKLNARRFWAIHTYKHTTIQYTHTYIHTCQKCMQILRHNHAKMHTYIQNQISTDF